MQEQTAALTAAPTDARPAAPRPPFHPFRARGFTLVEIAVVVAVIALLIALLLPALRMAKASSEWAASQNNLRQIATLLQGYTADNRDRCLPSQFDHRPPGVQFCGSMRAAQQVSGGTPVNPPLGVPLVGTWADILWTTGQLGSFVMPEIQGSEIVDDPDTGTAIGGYSYTFDSPDRLVYQVYPDNRQNILRSSVGIVRPYSLDPDSEAYPWGNGAGEREKDHPGYFAANNFFTAAPWLGLTSEGTPAPGEVGRYITSAKIRMPSQAVYLVDSRAGEVIDPGDIPWSGSDENLCEVEFRYPGATALLLCLDGHVQTEAKWESLLELQGPYYTSPAAPPAPGPLDPTPRGLKVTNLDRPDNPAP